MSRRNCNLSAIREAFLNILPRVLDILGIVAGIVVGFWHYYAPKGGTLGAWFEKSSGWELNAFAAFGAMSGFALASLALVASMSGHERAKDVIDSNAGRYLLRTLVGSTWAWFLAALSALVALVAASAWARVLVIVLASIACARGALALTALYLFFKRFTVEKPAR